MTREQLALARHKEMAAFRQDSSTGEAWGVRSPNRREFCRQVVERAGEIAIGLVQSQGWRQIFNITVESQLRLELEESLSSPLSDLKRAAGRLREAVVKFQFQNKEDPFLVIVLDGTSRPLAMRGSGETHEGRYAALNRIMSCLKEFRIWYFVLSADSNLNTLVAPSNTEQMRTDGDANPKGVMPLPPFPPFLALQLDVEDRRKMKDKKERRVELLKPMCQFSEPKHMAMFGRPRWLAFNNAEEMN